jgi:hypothetical protein
MMEMRFFCIKLHSLEIYLKCGLPLFFFHEPSIPSKNTFAEVVVYLVSNLIKIGKNATNTTRKCADKKIQGHPRKDFSNLIIHYNISFTKLIAGCSNGSACW